MNIRRNIWSLTKLSLIGLLCGAAISILSGFVSKNAPPIFFPFRLLQGNMIMYSNKPIPEVYNVLVKEAIADIARSPLYNDHMPLQVYLCDTEWIYSFFGSSNKDSTGIFKPDNGKIFVNHQKIDNLLELKRTLVHESGHAVIYNSLGKSRTALLPKWVLEGYAEYISKPKMTDVGFETDILILNKINPDNSYVRYRLLVAYALDVKKIPLQQLLDNPPKQSDLEKELGLHNYSKSS